MNKYTVRFDNGETTIIEADEYRMLDFSPHVNFYRHEKKKCDCGGNIEKTIRVATFNPEMVSVWLIE